MIDYGNVQEIGRVHGVDAALSEIEKIVTTFGATARLLVTKARYLQQTEYGELEEVREVLKRALALDDECVEAYIELGFFELYVEDSAAHARGYFESALRVIERQSVEAQKGLQECLSELAETQNGVG